MIERSTGINEIVAARFIGLAGGVVNRQALEGR